MPRVIVDLINAALLDDAAGIHDSDIISNLGHNAEIVRDVDHGEILLLLQILYEVEDLCLDSDIESGRRFIAYEDVRIACQRDCNDDTLPHSA